jgi:hypothetical protein
MSAAIIVIRRKRLIRAFREAGATDRSRAATPEQLGCRRDWIFEQLVRAGVFVARDAGRYYLDEAAAAVFQAKFRKQSLIFTAIFLLILVVVLLIEKSK